MNPHQCLPFTMPATLRNIAVYCVSLSAGLMLGDTLVARAADRPVVALICEQRNELPWIDVAEAALASDARIRLVDREHLGKVLTEQKLAVLMGPADGVARIKLGQIVGCDLLIVLRHEPKPLDILRVVIADTRTGIRLVTEELPVKQMAATQRLPADLLATALSKREIVDPIVLAIPPFANDDLSRRNQFLQSSLAAVCESVAARHPRILRVELEEARELSKEQALTTRETRRILPYYLLGRFRLEASNQQLPPLATLRLERGNTLVAEEKQPSPTPEAIGAFVREAAAALLSPIFDKAGTAEVDNAADAAKLAHQALAFMKVGDFREGARLAEASLLLDPNQLDLRHSLSDAYKRLAQLHSPYAGMSQQQFDRQFQTALSYAERGMRHFQSYLLATKESYKGNSHGVSLWDFVHHPRADAKTRAAIIEYTRDYREMLIEALEAKIKRGETTGDMGRLLHPALGYYHREDDGSLKQYLTNRLRLVRIVEEFPQHQRRYFYGEILTFGIASPDADAFAFYESFFNAPDPELAAAAKKAKAEGERMMGLRPRPAIARPAEPRPKPPVDVRSDLQVRLTPIVLNYRDNGQEIPLTFFQGLQSGGKDHEIAWGFRRERVVIYRHGEVPFRKLFETDNQHDFGTGCFDGRFFWLPVTGAHTQLLRIDPADGSLLKVTVEHGLPDLNVKAIRPITAPLEPGRIALVATFGPHGARRAFVAEITCGDDAQPRVRVVHEAREESIASDPRAAFEERKTNTKLAYLPIFAMPLSDQTSAVPSRVLIARILPGAGGATSSLLVDLSTGKAAISTAAAHSHLSPDNFAIHDGAAYWLASNKVWCITAEDPSKRQAIADIKEDHGALFFVKGGVLAIGVDCWFTEDWSRPFRKVPSGSQRFFKSYLNSSHISSHYGHVLKTSQQDWITYRVEVVHEGQSSP